MVSLLSNPRFRRYCLLVSPPRSLRAKFFIFFAATLTCIYVTSIFLPYALTSHQLFALATRASRAPGICPPRTWAAGKWVSKPPPTHRTGFNASSDAYEFLGLQGCASTREVFWHLAADNDKLWDRFPGVASWKWLPPSHCQIRDLDPEAVVKDLVEHGGWFLIDDSVTENHFLSLSCLLYAHVCATPNYIENQYWDRAWPQNLYMEPSSPLVRKLNFPPGFDIASTPLVTFRRVDLLLEPSRLDNLYQSLHPDSGHVNETCTTFRRPRTSKVSPLLCRIATMPRWSSARGVTGRHRAKRWRPG
ncbi:hypothetical protein C8Q80DRAFT_1327235 [Daedaleopsis nitida]|nr:hypothetical protein C8Q80DRAFT_1327235 [Daedaleopsis nitida]